ncbi:hypothetical protein GCK32_013876, partial [Trichostrongylus colubriformis]
CRIIRWMDRTVRKGIYQEFIEYIQTFLDGDDIMIQTDVILQTSSSFANFIYSKSYLGMWLKKLSAEWNQLSTQQIFECNARFIEWIRDADDRADEVQRMDDAEPYVPPAPTTSSFGPFALRVVIRGFIFQVCPSAALPDNEIMDWCQIIRKNHVDIVQVVSSAFVLVLNI